MRFETSQSMKLGQHMKLAPRMIQSMEILQMPLAELEERLAQELESNPTLEMADGDGSTPADAAGQPGDPSREAPGAESGPLTIDERSSADDFERLDSFEASNPDLIENEYSESAPRERASSDEDFDGLSYRTVRESSGERDAKMDAMAAAPARSASLVDQLRGQWALCEVDPVLRPLGEAILNFLEDDGSLKTPLETIADRAPVASARVPRDAASSTPALDQWERALRALQLFLEPAGIAARTPQECLTLQLDALEAGEGSAASWGDMGWPTGTIANARTLVQGHLDDLMQNRLPRVADKTGLSLEQIKEALMLLRRLSLAPGRRLVDVRERPIVPDAIVELDEASGKYIAYLNDAHLPTLRINEEYAKLSRDKAMPQRDREFIRTNLGNAQWLLDAVGQRRGTLLRVVQKVIEHQRDFFDFGPQALRPLPMTQVGEELGIHVATVSRAVAEKFIATPRGVMPLRKFFSGGVTTKPGSQASSTPAGPGTSTGVGTQPLPSLTPLGAMPASEQGDGAALLENSLAWEAIKQALRELIEAEDKKKPLSDEALADGLKQRGIEIARRTVAKYRDQLNIPAARLRKQF